MTPSSNAQNLRRRLIWTVAALLTLAVLAAVLALPAALSTLPGRDWLLSRANRTLAPGGLSIDGFKFSWFRPTRIHWFVLTSKEGERVVAAEHATWDRNLFQILFERPKLGTLTLDRAEVAVTRGPGGTIDLYETLRPVLGLNPKTAARIVVADGRLRVHGQGFAKPVEAEHAEVVVQIIPTPGPVIWKVELSKENLGGPRRQFFEVNGHLDRKATPGDLEIRVSGRDWPLALGGSRGGASGRLNGTLSAERKGGRWALAGEAGLAQVAVSGPGNERLRASLDPVAGSWNLDQTAEGWNVRKFLVSASGATLSATGRVSTKGTIDLSGEAHLAGLLPVANLRGRWSAEGTVATENGGFHVDGGLKVVPFSDDSREAEQPVELRVRASAPANIERIDLAELGITSRYGQMDASGRIDDPAGKRLADFSGKIAPNWEFINTWLAQNVEPGARVSGHDRAFRLRAALGAGGTQTAEGEIGVALDSIDVYGMKLGPLAVVFRAREGTFTLDPIDTTVNAGRLQLDPAFRPAEGSVPAAIVLGAGTKLTDAAVNDEVSRRVLSFVAPVLDNATRVRGRVSATINQAVFPIAEKGDGRGPKVDGSVVFQDLEFVPGPLLDGLFALTGREDRPTLKLNEPVALTIADRRVYQRGLTVPIGEVSKIELEGWVGFDRALNLTASVPILTNTLADRPILGAIAADARIRVPIRGTLKNPEIDREAFQLGMKDLGRSLLERGALQGAAGLLQRLSRPRDPNAPPLLPSAEERRARRQERRAERQSRRDATPD